VGTPSNPAADKFGRSIQAIDYDPAGPASVASFLLKGIPPPSALYIERDDVLILEGVSNVGGDTITVNLRIFSVDNVIVPMQLKAVLPSNESLGTFSLPLVEGFLLSASALAGTATTRGQTFIRAFLNRGAFSVGQPGQLLFADYVTNQVSAGYPGGRFLSPTEGPGFLTGFPVTNPGNGLDWALNVIGGERWKVRSFNATLTTSATVANRQPQVKINDLGNNLFFGNPSGNIPASTVAQVTGSAAPQFAATVTTDIMVPIPPDLYLTGTPGALMTIGVVTAGLQAGDAWSNIRLMLERWLDNV
jgi:hypothetical protein